jgi:hypothetical protein
MKRFSPILALLLIGCATPTETRKAVIRDTAGTPLTHARVELFGEPPKFFPFGIAMGPIYTDTATDRHGNCVLTYPKKRSWWIRATENHRNFFSRRIIERTDRLELTVAQPNLQ